MKFIEQTAKQAARKKSRRIFDSTQLFGKRDMAPAKHDLAKLLRDELILRFLGRNLNANPTELLEICSAFLFEFKAYPEEVLTSAIKDMREASPDEIATTHLFYFLKKRIADYFGCDDIDQLIFDAAVSKELGDNRKFHPFIEQIVDELPEYKWKLVRERISEIKHA